MNKKRKVNFTRTKIIATVGPSIKSERMLHSMVNAGVDVFRLNFSHGTHEEHKNSIDLIKKLNYNFDLHTCILCDLQGPKIRIGKIYNQPLILKKNQELIFSSNVSSEKNNDSIYINYSQFAKDVKKNDIVLVDDGKIELKVTDTNKKDTVKLKVVYPGPLNSNKGINLPNSHISLPCLTAKDMKDLKFALQYDADWIALSFVRSEKDIYELKEIIANANKKTRVIAKIEKPEALVNIDKIIEAADGIMVARGDLGVEIPVEEIPLAQKNIVIKCMEATKPVIIATQIMESMIQNPKPTRAETNDVANAVMDGADALMLSGETSVGKHPVKVIETMRKVIKRMEQDDRIYNKAHPIKKSLKTFNSDVLCYNSTLIAQELGAKAIVGMTKSGYTGFKTSSFRPNADIFVFSDNRFLLTSLNLIWGVRVFYYDKFISTDKTFHDVNQILKEQNLVFKGDIVINLASMPIHEKARTNTIKITQIL